MIKRILLFVISLFLSQQAFSSWEKIDCQEIFKGRDLTSIHASSVKINSVLSIQVTYRPVEGCGFRIKSEKRSRTFAFTKNEFNYLPLKSNGVPFGVKTFISSSSGRELQLFKDSESGDIRVQQPNGLEIFFSSKTGEIDEERTTDYQVEQTSYNSRTGGLILNRPKSPLITFPFETGYGGKSRTNSKIFIQVNDKSCNTGSESLFNYKYSCDKQTSEKRYCSLPKAEVLEKSKERYKEYEKGHIEFAKEQKNKGGRVPKKASYTKFLRDFIDGVTLKSENEEELSELLKKANCSSLIQAPLVTKTQVEPKTDLQVPVKVEPEAVTKTDKQIKLIKPKAPSKISHTKEKTKEGPETTKVQEEKEEHNVLGDSQRQKRDLCLEKLNEYFTSAHNKEELNEYLRIQAKVSLHRIAWVSMKSSSSNSKNIEGSILELLKQRNPTLHESFVKKNLKTRNQKLLSVMNELKIKSASFNHKKNIPFQLKYSDVKMVQLLVETEQKFGRSAASGARDFTSIITNSMKSRLDKKATNTKNFEKIIGVLVKKAKRIESKVQEFLAESGCATEADIISCGDKSKSLDIGKILENSEQVLDHFYSSQFERNNELYNNFKWNTKNKNYWLHVK